MGTTVQIHNELNSSLTYAVGEPMDKQLLKSVKKHEGLRTEAYQDSKGIWTCGYGRNLEEAGVDPVYAQFVCISEDQAEVWLIEDLDIAMDDAKSFPQFGKMNRARRNVFVEMNFQMGRTRVAKFENMLGSISLDTSVKPTNWEIVSNHMLDSKWAREDSPSRAIALAKTMRSGWYG